MKRILIIFVLVIIFILVSCTEQGGTSGGDSGNSSGSSSIESVNLNAKVQIYPENQVSQNKKFNIFDRFNKCAYAQYPAYVSPARAASDHIVAKIYGENSWGVAGSYKLNDINYLDVGSLVGYPQKLFVNVMVEVLEYSENANPMTLWVRGKDTGDPWIALYPTSETPAQAIVVTNATGEIEWKAQNTSWYDWKDDVLGDPDFHYYGWQTFKVYRNGVTLAIE